MVYMKRESAEQERSYTTTSHVDPLHRLHPPPRAAWMVVRADGSWVGTIGSRSMQHKTLQDTWAALAADRPHLVQYPLIGRPPEPGPLRRHPGSVHRRPHPSPAQRTRG
ncbi:MAG TPA: hypothetical protein DEP84_23185 [Chloroflexi bacterium]|nr:hypothetical protein [Chloroflexota bacterium]